MHITALPEKKCRVANYFDVESSEVLDAGFPQELTMIGNWKCRTGELGEEIYLAEPSVKSCLYENKLLSDSRNLR